MEQATVQREQCVFSCSQRMCQSLDKAGVPPDARWRTMILFMRSMKEHYFLSPQQKQELQSILLTVVKNKEYSDEKFKEVVKKNEKILNAPYIEKLNETIDESERLLLEFQQLLLERKGNVTSLEAQTVSTIEASRNPKTIINDLRVAFREVVSAMEQDVAKLDNLSRTDGLTSLSNRRAFDDYLLAQIHLAQKHCHPLSLLMIDVDFFKKFNDQYGHRIGDQALISVAKVMKENVEWLRTSEGQICFPARYGGEEFTVVMPEAEAAVAEAFAEILRHKIESYNFMIRDGNGGIIRKGIKITVSIGVASLPNNCGDSIEHLRDRLIESSDKALYEAKNQGRNRVCLA